MSAATLSLSVPAFSVPSASINASGSFLFPPFLQPASSLILFQYSCVFLSRVHCSMSFIFSFHHCFCNCFLNLLICLTACLYLSVCSPPVCSLAAAFFSVLNTLSCALIMSSSVCPFTLPLFLAFARLFPSLNTLNTPFFNKLQLSPTSSLYLSISSSVFSNSDSAPSRKPFQNCGSTMRDTSLKFSFLCCCSLPA